MVEKNQLESADGTSPAAPNTSFEEMRTILPQTLEELGRTDEVTATIPPSPLSAIDEPAAESPAGFPHIPGYRILKELGKGGMGVVYQAEQVKLHRLVALKMIRGGFVERQEQRQRFLSEAEAVARLHHPNIVQIFEVGDVQHPDGSVSPFMALEFVAGPSLEDDLQGKPLLPRVAAELVMQLAFAMHSAHEHHLVHRDLKPANVLLAPTDSGHSKILQQTEVRTRLAGPSVLSFVPKITDFGLAKQIDANSSQTKAGEIMGTPSYMAPEQAEAKKDIGPSADTYALGAILYETLSGRPPFRAATSLDTILQVIMQDPVPPSKLQPHTPRDLETICLKCLAKTPPKRYATARELAEDLQRYLNDEPILARPTGWTERTWKWAKRRPAAAALVAVSVLALIGFLVGAIIFNQIVREERDVAVEAKKDAQTQRDEARGAKRKADDSATETQRTLDFFAVSTGLRLIEQGEFYRGLLWCSRPLQETGPYRGPEAAFRERLVQHLHFGNRPTLLQVFVTDSNLHSAVFSPDSKWIATAHKDRAVPVWEAASGQLVHLLKDAGDRQVAFRPDGSRLLTVGGKAAILWDTKTWSKAGTAQHEDTVNRARFSPDGGRFVTVSEDRTARLWSSDDGESLGEPLVHQSPVNDAAFLGEGNVLATGSGAYGGGLRPSTPGQLRLWDTASAEALGASVSFPQGVLRVAISPDGKTAAGVSEDGTLRFLDVDKRQAKGPTIKAATGPRMLAFPPQGDRIAVAGSDHALTVWEVGTGRQEQRLAHADNVNGVEYTRDGRLVATNSEDKTARISDVATGQPVTPSLPHRGEVTCAVWSPSEKQLLTGSDDGTARLWDVASRQARPIARGEHGKGILSVAVAPDGSVVASGGDGKDIRFWKLPGGEPVGESLPFPGVHLQLAFDSDSQRLAAWGDHEEAHVWDLSRRQHAFPPLKHAKWVNALAFSPDGRWLATGSRDATAKIWSSQDGRLLHTLPHQSSVRTLTFSPDSATLLTGSDDGTVRFWDRETGKERFAPQRQGQLPVWATAFSPDGESAATGGIDYTTRLWKVRTGEALMPPLHHQYEVMSVAFHPDGRRLLTASFDKTARLWDAATGQSLGPPLQHDGWVIKAIFSPDGSHVATISRDRTARFWDPDTGQALSPSLPHGGRVVTAAFSPDGRTLVTGCFDPNLRFWRLPENPRPAADLIELVELYDGHRLNKLGGLEQLSNKEIQSRFKRLQKQYPEEFTPR